jgi:hypothetical protein
VTTHTVVTVFSESALCSLSGVRISILIITQEGYALRLRVRQGQVGGDRELEYGDVIGVNRGLYEHYGIYCGNLEVIHYTYLPLRLPWKRYRIYRTSMEHFLGDSNELFVLDCSDPRNPEKSKPITIDARKLPPLLEWFFEYQIDKYFHLYSPEETVERAESQLGKGKYNLLVNNCEHFAIWCKTGLHKSYQVEEVLKHFARIVYTVS